MFNLNEPELAMTKVKDFCFTIKKLIEQLTLFKKMGYDG